MEWLPCVTSRTGRKACQRLQTTKAPTPHRFRSNPHEAHAPDENRPFPFSLPLNTGNIVSLSEQQFADYDIMDPGFQQGKRLRN